MDDLCEAIDMVEIRTDGRDPPAAPAPAPAAQQPADEGIVGKVGSILESTRDRLVQLVTENRDTVKHAVLAVLFALYNAYFILCIYIANNENSGTYDYTNGVGFLIVVTGIVYVGLFYFQIVKPFWGKIINQRVLKPMGQFYDQLSNNRWFAPSVCFLLVVALVTFLAIDTKDDRNRLFSFGGLLLFLLLGWVFSKHPSKVQWKQVVWGLAIQFVFGLMVLRWDLGRNVVDVLGRKITSFLKYTDAGSGFVYGYLVSDDNKSDVALGFIFAFKILSVAFFFSFTVSILYYYGVMQWLVQKIGWLLQITVGTTAAESANAAANIFLGQTEAPLVIKPYIAVMTKSELHAVMTGGFATIAGSVLAAYISFGIDAAHLLSASIMSAPAALAFSKLFYPETEASGTNVREIKLENGKEANALDAAAQGASNAVMLVANIIANLISFLAFVAFLNGIVSWFCGLLGFPYVTFEFIAGKLFIPIAWMMGVPHDECNSVGSLVAIKTIVNEFAAYAKLSEMVKAKMISKRSERIATYALCGFSNPGSIGAAIAALGTLAPERKSDLARIAFRAFIAGNVACFMTACIAGTLIDSTG